MRRPIGCWLPVCLKPSAIGGVPLCGFADGLYLFKNSELTAVGFLTAVFLSRIWRMDADERGTHPLSRPKDTKSIQSFLRYAMFLSAMTELFNVGRRWWWTGAMGDVCPPPDIWRSLFACTARYRKVARFFLEIMDF